MPTRLGFRGELKLFAQVKIRQSDTILGCIYCNLYDLDSTSLEETRDKSTFPLAAS